MTIRDDELQNRRTRRDSQEEGNASVVAFVTPTGEAKEWTGDEDAPYTEPFAQVISDLDAVDASNVRDYDNIRLIATPEGVLYVNPVQSPATEATRVQGDILWGAPDSELVRRPVKIGGTAYGTDADIVSNQVSAFQRVNALFDLQGRLGVLPWALTRDEVTLRADAALAAAGAYAATTVVDVTYYRNMALFSRYTPGAAGGFPYIIPMVSSAAVQPAVTDDNWYAMKVNATALPTELTPAGAFPAGVDATAAPAWGVVQRDKLILRPIAGTATGNRFREADELKVEAYKWLFFLVAEVGVTGTPGSLGLRYNLSL